MVFPQLTDYADFGFLLPRLMVSFLFITSSLRSDGIEMDGRLVQESE